LSVQRYGMDITIVCTKCGETSERSRPKSQVCRKCNSEWHQAYRQKHRVRLIARDRARYNSVKNDPEFRAAEKKRGLGYYRQVRDEAFMAYGGFRCSCECGCNISEPLFLELDHIAGNGAEHRRSLGFPGNGKGACNSMYQHLKRDGYPEGFRVLCSNCNKGRFRNGGTCPALKS